MEIDTNANTTAAPAMAASHTVAAAPLAPVALTVVTLPPPLAERAGTGMEEPDSPMMTPPSSPPPAIDTEQKFAESDSLSSPPLSALKSDDSADGLTEAVLATPVTVLCGVCYVPCDTYAVNPRFLTCSGCSISVHIECYGISKMSKSHSKGQRRRWKCEKCRLDDFMRIPIYTPSSTHSLCTMCPNADFALMLAQPREHTTDETNGSGETAVAVNPHDPFGYHSQSSVRYLHPLLESYAFCHTVCALFLPGCRFETHHQDYHSGAPLPVSMPWATRKKHRSYQLVMGTNDIPADYWGKKCDLCQSDFGASLRCSHTDTEGNQCTQIMHVTCALLQNLTLEIKQHPTISDSVGCLSFCQTHTPPTPVVTGSPAMSLYYNQMGMTARQWQRQTYNNTAFAFPWAMQKHTGPGLQSPPALLSQSSASPSPPLSNGFASPPPIDFASPSASMSVGGIAMNVS